MTFHSPFLPIGSLDHHCFASLPFPEGEWLGPVYSSTGSVKILLCVQKLYKTEHVAESQRIQCSCALDPSLTLPKAKPDKRGVEKKNLQFISSQKIPLPLDLVVKDFDKWTGSTREGKFSVCMNTIDLKLHYEILNNNSMFIFIITPYLL